MDWKVVRAGNADHERTVLNKILDEIHATVQTIEARIEELNGENGGGGSSDPTTVSVDTSNLTVSVADNNYHIDIKDGGVGSDELADALDFTGKTVSGGTFDDPALTGNATLDGNEIWHAGNLLDIGTTPATARTALELGTMATQDSDSVTITGGTIEADALALVAGNDKQVQFNDAGALAGHAGLIYDKTNRRLEIVPFAGTGQYRISSANGHSNWDSYDSAGGTGYTITAVGPSSSQGIVEAFANTGTALTRLRVDDGAGNVRTFAFDTSSSKPAWFNGISFDDVLISSDIGSSVQGYNDGLQLISIAYTAGDFVVGAGSKQLVAFNSSGDADGVLMSDFVISIANSALASDFRSAIGLGTAATQNTGTSGANVPLLSTANLWAEDQRLENANYLRGTTSGGTSTRMFGINASDVVFIGSVDAAVGELRFNVNGSTWGTLNATGWTSTGFLSNSGGIGYTTGAGGTVTQLVDKATSVTLNEVTGVITTANVALAAGAIVSFTFNNSTVAATDLIVHSHHATGTIGAYTLNIRATGAGTASVTIRNNTAGSLTEAIQIKYAVIKSVTA